MSITDSKQVSKVVYGDKTLIDLTTDTITADKLVSGFTAHNKAGQSITGTLVVPTPPSGTFEVLQNGTYDITEYAEVDVNVAGLVPTGNIELTQQTGTDVTNYATASVRSGSVTIDTPTVSSSGLITASASVGTTGWIGSAPSSKTTQLPTQGAKTVTPSSSSQTAVSSGVYTTGTVTVAAVPTETKTVNLAMSSGNQTINATSGKFMTSVIINKPNTLLPENIKKDIDIGGIVGTYEGGGGGAVEPYIEETYNENGELVDVNMHGYTRLRDYAFSNCSKLSSFNLNSITSIGKQAFNGCTGLALDSLPNSVTSIDSGAFIGCTSLVNMEIASTQLGTGTRIFYQCTGLRKVWFRNTCTKVTASSSTNAPFAGCSTSLQIYCEQESKPSNYGTYFNRTGSNGGNTVTVVYGQTTRPW